jgi:hypothetical protein
MKKIFTYLSIGINDVKYALKLHVYTCCCQIEI